MSTSQRSHRRWSIDLRRKDSRLPSPAAFVERTSDFEVDAGGSEKAALITKRSWDVAFGPMKQIPMNLMFSYMAGKNISSIFTIIFVVMMFWRPIQAFLQYQPVFRTIEGNLASLQKSVWILGNLLLLCIALYKCHSMGLLPLYESDWLAFVMPATKHEYVAGGMAF